MSAPTVSFCIATMNRAHAIGASLESIALQLAVGDSPEIVIVDSSRDEATARVVERLRDRLPGLRYDRQEPCGIDRAYLRAVDLARGEYCWLFTDDDWLLDGAIDAVRAALADRPDCVLVNYESRDAEMQQVLGPTHVPFAGDREYGPADFQGFARDTLWLTTYVGAVVARRTLWAERDLRPYCGSEYAHMGLLYERPLAGRAKVLGHPWIALRWGVSHWRVRAFQVEMFKLPEFLWSLPALTDATRAALSTREPWRSPKRLVRFRAVGAFGWNEYRRWLVPRAPGLKVHALALALCLVPGTWVRRLAWWYGRWRHPGVAFYDFEFGGRMRP